MICKCSILLLIKKSRIFGFITTQSFSGLLGFTFWIVPSVADSYGIAKFVYSSGTVIDGGGTGSGIGILIGTPQCPIVVPARRRANIHNVPWPGVSKLPVSGGDVSLRQDEYFRIQQVTEAFLAFFHHQPFPAYIQWRDISGEVTVAGCTKPTDSKNVPSQEH